MADAFTDPMGYLIAGQKLTRGISATYTDAKTQTPLALIVIEGQTLFSSNVQNAARVEWGELEVIIEAADLTIAGDMVEPAAGDQLAMTFNGVPGVYEVSIPNTGEPAWRYLRERRLVRLHCKRVA